MRDQSWVQNPPLVLQKVSIKLFSCSSTCALRRDAIAGEEKEVAREEKRLQEKRREAITRGEKRLPEERSYNKRRENGYKRRESVTREIRGYKRRGAVTKEYNWLQEKRRQEVTRQETR